jgi:inner membrane protein
MEIFVIILIILLAFGLGIFFVARLIYIHYFKDKINMETPKKKFTQTLAFKGFTIATLVLLLLIPSAMIQGLIEERQKRSSETIQKINDKWSRSQTLCMPLLLVPYTTTKIAGADKLYYEEHTLCITPKELKINAVLNPEERHYGIYKAILYKSDIHFEGDFSDLANLKIDDNGKLHLDKAQIAIGVTDLRGVTQNPDFKIAGKPLETTVGVVKLFSVFEEKRSQKRQHKSPRHQVCGYVSRVAPPRLDMGPSVKGAAKVLIYEQIVCVAGPALGRGGDVPWQDDR